MSTITFNKVIFPNTPSGNQTLSLEYKLSTQPSSSYVTIDSSVTVAPNGDIIDSPLPGVSGLTSGALYNFRWTQHCGSPAPYWIENITAE